MSPMGTIFHQIVAFPLFSPRSFYSRPCARGWVWRCSMHQAPPAAWHTVSSGSANALTLVSANLGKLSHDRHSPTPLPAL